MTSIKLRNGRRVLLGAVALLTLTSVYQVVTNRGELARVRATLVQAQYQLRMTRDSLSAARQRVAQLQKDVAAGQHQLHDIRTRVQAAHREYVRWQAEEAPVRPPSEHAEAYRRRRQSLRQAAQRWSIE